MTEEVEYEVLRRLGSVELRRYPRLTLATVAGASDDEAFSALFEYLSGDGIPSRRIAMTAPVVSTGDSFSFAMPSGESIETLPRPRNERIKIVEVPERVVAALRFRGKTSPEKVRTKERELTLALAAARLPTKGGVFLMRYNPPFMPGLLRRNEIGIEVSSTSGSGPR